MVTVTHARRPERLGSTRTVAACLAAVLLVSTLGLLAGPRTALARTYPDIGDQPADIQSAIDYVTGKGYMSGAADGNFCPNDSVKRLEYACTVVKLFKKQNEQIDPGIHFTDLSDSDPNFKYANIAVKYNYIFAIPDGSFHPYDYHSTVCCMAGLVKGLGLDDSTDDPVYSLWGLWPGGPPYSGQSVVSSDLHLRYRDTRTTPNGIYPRGEFAYAIQKVEQVEAWRIQYVKDSFNRLSCQSPLTGPQRGKALDSAFAKVGHPYVWGGESDAEGGYDCSGLTYYVLDSVLGYPMLRVADDQARDGRYATVPRAQLLPGDPIFFYKDPSSSTYVGHAGMYVGRGMFIHSTGSNAGVSVDYLSGYWSDHFACGKRVIPEPEPESFDTYILLSNPTASTAQARLIYMLRDGRQVALEKSLEPYSRKTVKVDDTLVNEEVSTKVEATKGQVVAERSMYFRYMNQYPGGHASPGSTEPATEWFLAEGCTAYGFDTFVLVQNPGGETADVKLTFMKQGGQTQDLHISVAPYSRYTAAVDRLQGMEQAEFSTVVASSRPVVVERSMYFDYGGIQEGHNSEGLTGLSQDWYFAEGYTANWFDTYVLLANPSDQPVNAIMSLLGDDGEKTDLTVEIKAHARQTVAVDRIQGWESRAFSVKIHSDVPIAVERAMYFDYNGITGGHDAVGCAVPATRWFLAEGYTAGDFDTYVLLSNPGEEPADVSVRFMLNGGRFIDRAYTVRAHSRFTIQVDKEPGLAAEEVSTLVSSSRPIVAERSMYFRYMGRSGGSCSNGVPGLATKWYFAEGYTGR